MCVILIYYIFNCGLTVIVVVVNVDTNYVYLDGI